MPYSREEEILHRQTKKSLDSQVGLPHPQSIIMKSYPLVQSHFYTAVHSTLALAEKQIAFPASLGLHFWRLLCHINLWFICYTFFLFTCNRDSTPWNPETFTIQPLTETVCQYLIHTELSFSFGCENIQATRKRFINGDFNNNLLAFEQLDSSFKCKSYSSFKTLVDPSIVF